VGVEANYPCQAEPRPRRVLKQSLEVFSIGHAHLLASLKNPFAPHAWDPEAQKLPQLIEAVFICSHTYSQAKAALRSPWHGLKMWIWAKAMGRFDPFLEREILRDHILEACATPEIWQMKGRVLGSPTLLLLWQHLRWGRGLEEEATMEYGFGKAMWDYFAHHEKSGGIQIVNETEAAGMRMLREMQASEKAAKQQRPAKGPQWPDESELAKGVAGDGI
jgi:hypothetical protein